MMMNKKIGEPSISVVASSFVSVCWNTKCDMFLMLNSLDSLAAAECGVLACVRVVLALFVCLVLSCCVFFCCQ